MMSKRESISEPTDSEPTVLSIDGRRQGPIAEFLALKKIVLKKSLKNGQVQSMNANKFWCFSGRIEFFFNTIFCQ